MSDAYLQSLAVLQRIRARAGGELKLPQICVVGDQSSGKSSVLSRLTGIDFPVKDGICTKAAIVVECRRDELARHDRHEVWSRDQSNQDNAGQDMTSINATAGRYEGCSLDQLAKRITDIQNAALVECGRKISEEEILVRVTGPMQMDIIVIDLPGIINQGEGVQETRKLIEKYISQDETLILLVSEAKQDDELVTALGMAKTHDPTGGRTKRILTKFDSFDSDESKKRAVALANNSAAGGESSPSGRRSPERGLSAAANDLMGAHAVICRPNGRKEYDAAAEREELQKLGLNEGSFGIGALKGALPSIYATLIQTNLPKLKRSAEEKCGDARAKLRKIGERPTDSTLMIKACQDALTSAKTSIDEEMTEPILKFQEAIIKTEGSVTREWSDGKLRPNVFMCPLFYGNEALRVCMDEITKWWEPILVKLIAGTKDVVLNRVHDTLGAELGCGVPDHLRNCMDHAWKAKCEQVFKTFSGKCEQILKKEIDYGTLNHHLSTKFAADRTFPEQVMDAFIASIEESDYSPGNLFGKSCCELAVVKQNIRKKLLDQKQLFESAFETKTLHKQQQDRLFDAVKALWAVEHKTFIDVILKEVRSVPRQALHEWISTELLTSAEIRRNAVEDRETEKLRAHLKDLITKMEEALGELESLNAGKC